MTRWMMTTCFRWDRKKSTKIPASNVWFYDGVVENSPSYAAAVSNSDGASQEPSIRNRMAGSVLTEIAFGGGMSSLTSSMYGSSWPSK